VADHKTLGGGDLSITAGEVAELAEVSRAAVSNWRRRFADFPKPVATAPGGGDLFRMAEIQDWLREHGRLVGGIAVDKALWNAIDAHRATLGVDRTVQIAAGFISLIAIDSRHQMRLSTKSSDADISSVVDELVKELAVGRPDLRDLFAPLIDAMRAPDGDIRRLLSVLLELTLDADSPDDAFEALLERRDRLRVYGGTEHESAGALTDLMIAMSEPVGSVFDPAVGEAGFLVAAAMRAENDEDVDLDLIGQEVNEGTRRIALLRCLAHGLSAEIYLGDSLVNDAVPHLRADVIVCDPPFGQRPLSPPNPTDPRWFAGPPSEASADLTWMQHVIYHLGVRGRGYVAMPMGSLFRAGREGVIRRELVRRGCVEAVVALPSGLVKGSPSPASLWIVRPPHEEVAKPVLLINAAGSSRDGRRGLDESLSSRIVATVERFRRDPGRFEGEQGFAVAVPVLDLLALDSTLVPAHWITEAIPLDEAIAAIRQVERDIAVSRKEAIEADEVPRLDVKLVEQHRKTVKVRELVDAGAIEVIRGVAIPKDLPDSASGAPVLRSPWSRAAEEAERRVDLGRLKGKPKLTEPGDVVVMIVGNVPRAFVDSAGGHAIPEFMQAVRIRSASFEPTVLAALLSAPANARFVVGATIPRLSLMEVELPRLTPEETEVLREVLVKAAQQEAVATAMRDAAAAFRDRLLDAVISGQVAIGLRPDPANNRRG